MVTLPSVPDAPQARDVAKLPHEWSLDFQSAPVDVAFALLARQLSEIADAKIPNIRDMQCDVVVNPGGTCSLYFRAYR